MKWWDRLRGRQWPAAASVMQVKLITDQGNWFRAWDGSLYRSDVVRAAMRPKTKAVGKLVAMHVREAAAGMQINPEPYLRLLLEEPNPYSSGQMFRERMVNLLQLNNNAFARIYRDENGLPVQLYPIPATTAEALRTEDGSIQIRFMLPRGGEMVVPYEDLIHLRDDYNDNDLFGSPKAEALKALLEVVSVSDQSIVNAVRRSNIIRWLMKFRQPLRPEDTRRLVQEFADEYLSIENDTGIMPEDSRFQVEPVRDSQQPYVPGSPLQQWAVERVYSFFGVNEKIVQARYTEDEWVAYFEAEIEPLARQMSEEFTRKLFTRRERGFGNRIIFDATSLAHASMRTKLELVRMVDRGAMTPNEWRRTLNLPPIEGGDVPIRRLDTAEVDSVEDDSEGEDRRNGVLVTRGGR